MASMATRRWLLACLSFCPFLLSPSWVGPLGTRRAQSSRSSALRAVALSRITTGDTLLQKQKLEEDEERLKSLADFDLGMPDVNDLPEITALMVECFDRIIAKKRWDSKIPFSEYVNPFIDQNEVKEIAQGVRMRLDVTLQFQSLRRPIKQDESVALVAREKQGGPLVAYVEICILPNDGRRPEDDDGKTTSGTTREPYLSNLCVSPAYRRSGIGRAMLRLAEDVIRFIWKDERIYLHIDNYDPARLLYESEGFVATGPMDSEQVTHMIKGLPPLEEEDEDDEDAEDEEELPAEAEAEAGEPLALPAGESE